MATVRPRLRAASMRFEKWQALGNDYLIVERDELPFELTPARVRRLCEAHFGVCADGVLLLSAPGGPRARGRPAHLQPRRLGGRAVGQRRARGDPVPAPPRLDRPGRVLDPHRRRADPPDDHRPGHLPRGHGQARASTSERLPRRPAGRARRAARRRAGARMGASSTSRSATPSARSPSATRPSCERSTWRAVGPPIEGHRAVPQPHERLLVRRARPRGPPARIRARIFERGVGETLSSGTGASGAAVAYAARARRQAAAPRARVTVVLDGGELEVEVGEDLQRAPDRLGAAGVRGRSARVRGELAERAMARDRDRRSR